MRNTELISYAGIMINYLNDSNKQYLEINHCHIDVPKTTKCFIIKFFQS